MAITVSEDLISPDIGSYQDYNGRRVARRFLVKDLPPGPSIFTLAESAIRNQSGVFYGSPHPSDINQFCKVIECKPFLNSLTDVSARVEYGPPEILFETIIRWNGTVLEAETNLDRDGDPILVDYKTSDGIQMPTRIASVVGFFAEGILEFERTLFTLPSYSKELQGCSNGSAWQGGAPATWLCRESSFEQLLYRGTYRQRLAFWFRKRTFYPFATYTDINGFTPKDIDPINYTAPAVKGNGWRRAIITPGSYNFNTLGLPTVFS